MSAGIGCNMGWTDCRARREAASRPKAGERRQLIVQNVQAAGFSVMVPVTERLLFSRDPPPPPLGTKPSGSVGHPYDRHST